MGEKAGRRKDELPEASEDRVIECPVCSNIMTKMEAEGVTVEAVQEYSGQRSRSCKESAIASPCDKRWSCHYDSVRG
jgi:hypothetical protein